MYFMSLLTVVISIAGTLSFQHPEIDINRLKLLTNDVYNYPQRIEHNRPNSHELNNRNQVTLRHDKITATKTPIKVYQPREDPRHFYQSESYLKKNDVTKIDNEVSATYPGREVVWAKDTSGQKAARLKRKRGRTTFRVAGYCMKCPHDKVLIAKRGSDRVLLQTPRLMTCRGRPAPRSMRFLHTYGPKFGSLVERGTHYVVGRIVDDEGAKSIKQCKMEVTVITQSCPVPKYLRAQCADDQPGACNFTCRDPRMLLQGETTLVCADDLKWRGNLPLCTASTWCELPAPPSHGRVHCQGATSGNNFVEGAQCRVRCQRGWRSNNRAVPTVCRQGAWTKPLTCQPRINI